MKGYHQKVANIEIATVKFICTRKCSVCTVYCNNRPITRLITWSVSAVSLESEVMCVRLPIANSCLVQVSSCSSLTRKVRVAYIVALQFKKNCQYEKNVYVNS